MRDWGSFARASRGTSRTAVSFAEHACLKHSGRVGRSAAAKELDPEAVRLAVMAHIRHAETRYDTLLAEGWDRFEARGEVRGEVSDVLETWRQPGGGPGRLDLPPTTGHVMN